MCQYREISVDYQDDYRSNVDIINKLCIEKDNVKVWQNCRLLYFVIHVNN